MSDYFGEIQYKEHEFHYSFSERTCQLEITGKKDKIHEWRSKHEGGWLKLTNCNFLELIIRLGIEKYTGSRESCLYEVDDCFVLYNFKDCAKEEIHRISYRSNVLDYFYRPKGRIARVAKKLNYCSGKKTVCPLRVKRYPFKIGNKDLEIFFDETIELKPYQAKDIEVYNIMYVESKESLTYDEVIEVNTLVKRFLSFVSNMRKISVDYIGINAYKYQERNVYRCGHYVVNDPKECTLTGIALDYDSISSKIGDILDLVCNDNICFISLFQYEDGKIGTVDIMNVCATFECQFKITYPGYKNKEFEGARNEIVNGIKQIIDTKKIGGEDVSDYEAIMHSVKLYNDTLLHRLEYAFADFKKFVAEYTNNPALYLGNDYDAIPKLIKNARNKLDHGSKKNEVYANELISTVTVRIVIYFMILKSAGLRGKKLAKCMNNFFSIPLIVE